MTDEPQETPPPDPGQATPPPNPGQVPGGYPPPPGAYSPPPQYGQYPPPGQYPPGQYGYQPVYAAPKHPQATLAMVLGIIGLTSLMCYVTAFVAPFAWWIGAKAVKEIDAEPGRYGGRGEAMAGKIMGIIGTVLLIIALIAVAFFVTMAIVDPSFYDDSGYEDYSIVGAF
jgi:hypothetical protein